MNLEEETLLREAIKLARQKRYQSALQIIDILLQKNPNLAIGWSIKSRIHTQLKQYDQALYARNRNQEIDRQRRTELNPESKLQGIPKL